MSKYDKELDTRTNEYEKATKPLPRPEEQPPKKREQARRDEAPRHKK